MGKNGRKPAATNVAKETKVINLEKVEEATIVEETTNEKPKQVVDETTGEKEKLIVAKEKGDDAAGEDNGERGVIVYNAITDDMANEELVFEENGVLLTTHEEKMLAMRKAYRLAVLRKFNIKIRDVDGKVEKHLLVINGVDFRVSLPGWLKDEEGIPTENIKTYHERVWKQARIAFFTTLRGAERMDFAQFLG